MTKLRMVLSEGIADSLESLTRNRPALVHLCRMHVLGVCLQEAFCLLQTSTHVIALFLNCLFISKIFLLAYLELAFESPAFLQETRKLLRRPHPI